MERKAKAAKDYKTSVKNKIIAEEQRIEAEKKAKRIEKFWKANQKLKQELEEEKKQCQDKIAELTKEKNAINATKEIHEIQEEIKLVNATLATLGFFAFKEKKAKRETIANLEKEVQAHKDRVESEKAILQRKIDAQTRRINEINNEFTKDRPE